MGLLTSFKPSIPMAALRSLLDWAGGGRLAWWCTMSHLQGGRKESQEVTLSSEAFGAATL